MLHNNDSESQLIDAGTGLEDCGGVARFATLAHKLKAQALEGCSNCGVAMVSSGDNFLAGPELNASFQKGVPFYDAIAMDLIGYDAVCLGNHEFDFGPDTLADFIEGFPRTVKFLSANLDFSQEPRLQDFVRRHQLAGSLVVEKAGEK
ncbi:MAG: bifunctional metallophosphatase/5'-nucleotidase, partial [Proteobacteria bacterium]|nr:bifunctional metallophosphatase/5'-nucleotidase [Pseudomonadota bacterium]